MTIDLSIIFSLPSPAVSCPRRSEVRTRFLLLPIEPTLLLLRYLYVSDSMKGLREMGVQTKVHI